MSMAPAIPRQRDHDDDSRDRLDRINDGLAEVRVTLARIDERQAQRAEDDKTTRRLAEDHETRIRNLERYRYALPATTVAAVASLLATLLHH